MNFIAAIALDSKNKLKKAHFGDADQYYILEINSNSAEKKENIINPYLVEEEYDHQHGHKGKGKGIVKFLSKRGVKVLVARQFGKNIKIVSKSFTIILSQKTELDQVKRLLLQNRQKIIESLQDPKASQILKF